VSQRGLAVEAVADDTSAGHEVTVASGRRWTVPVAVLAAGALIGFGAVASGGATDEPDTAASPTTSALSIEPPSTTNGPSTTAGAVRERFTAPFGLPAGMTLVGLTRGQRVTARLAFGEVVARPIEESVLDQVDDGYLDFLTGFAVGQNAVFQLGQAMVVPVDIDRPTELLSSSCGAFGPVRDRMWIVDCASSEDEPPRARLRFVEP
jgi:hypothetical protein